MRPTTHLISLGTPFACPWARTSKWLGVALAGLLVGAAGCGSGTTELVAGKDDLGHVHDLVLDDDGVLLAATHTGLYRIEDLNRAVLVGTEQHDLMSMVMLDSGDIIASGHPDLRLEQYRLEDHRPFLGIARGRDTGETWEVMGLLGESDFHALAPAADGIFAAETAGRIWLLDTDGAGWRELGELEARDLAIDPTASDHQVATDYEGIVWASTDGAATWAELPDAPPLIEIEWIEESQILGAEESGSLWITESVDGPWTMVAAGPTEIETLYVDKSGSWWVAVHGGGMSRSDDRGASWVDVYVPPDSD